MAGFLGRCGLICGVVPTTVSALITSYGVRRAQFLDVAWGPQTLPWEGITIQKRFQSARKKISCLLLKKLKQCFTTCIACTWRSHKMVTKRFTLKQLTAKTPHYKWHIGESILRTATTMNKLCSTFVAIGDSRLYSTVHALALKFLVISGSQLLEYSLHGVSSNIHCIPPLQTSCWRFCKSTE